MSGCVQCKILRKWIKPACKSTPLLKHGWQLPDAITGSPALLFNNDGSIREGVATYNYRNGPMKRALSV